MDKKSQNKNLLFVGPFPPPYGGIASHLYDLLPALVDCGYECTTLTEVYGKGSLNVSAGGKIKNIYFSNRRYFFKKIIGIFLKTMASLKLKKDLTWREYVYSIFLAERTLLEVKKSKISMVFVYSITNGIMIPFLKKYTKNRCPVALMIFGAFYLHPAKYIKQKEYMYQIFNSCDLILASSQYCADSIKNIFGYDFFVRVVYIGVDQSFYFPRVPDIELKKRLDLPLDAKIVLFLARMDKSMGLDFMLEISHNLLNLDPNLYLIIGGAKGLLSDEACLLSRNDDRVRYCPNIPIEEKPSYYSIANVVVAPTMPTHACMGVTIKEAMLSKKPVIASASGGILEAIEDGESGWIVDFKDGRLDEDCFLEKTKKVLNDSEASEKLAMVGYEKAMKLFTNTISVRRYLSFIEMF